MPPTIAVIEVPRPPGDAKLLAQHNNLRGCSAATCRRVGIRGNSPSGLPGVTFRRGGFILVSVLLIVALATVLVVATSMVARIERTAASNALATERARANALFALDVALDQLQTATGPDQRTTARADILNSAGAPFEQPYWTGAWKTFNPANTAAYKYELDVGVDALRPWSYATPTWLVSNPNPGTALNPATWTGATTGTNPDAVKMAVVGGTTTSDVLVPRVQMKVEASSNAVLGAYAYWVQDEGIKAKVNLVPGSDSELANNPLRYLAPSSTAAEQALAEDWRSEMKTRLSGNGSADLSKVKTPASLDFVLGGNFSSSSDGLAESSPDITTHSFGVLSDTRRGGLKTDLTAAFESLNDNSSSTPGFFEALTGRRPPGRDETGGGSDDLWSGKLWRLPGILPNISSTYFDGNRWYSFYHHYNLYKSQVPRYKSSENQFNPQRSKGLGGVGGTSVGYAYVRRSATNNNSVSIGGIFPELVGLRFGVYFSTTNGGTGIRLHYSPRLVLHNPYSVGILPGLDGTTPTSQTDFQFTNNFLNMSGVSVTIRNLTTGTTLYSGAPTASALNSDIGVANSHMNFSPGEVKIFGGNAARNTINYKYYNNPSEYPLVSNFNETFNYWDVPLSGPLAPADALEITIRTRVGDSNSIRWLFQGGNLGEIRRNPLVADSTLTVVSGEPASAFETNPGDPPTPLFVVFMRAKGLLAENTPFTPSSGYSGALWNPYCLNKNSYLWETDVVFRATYDSSDEMQTDGSGRSFWFQCDAGRGGGESSIIQAEVFDAPMVSVAQLRHARGALSLYASQNPQSNFHQSFPQFGTSWPNSELNSQTSGNQTSLWEIPASGPNAGNVLAVDDVFLNNEALFDKFYFSTVPPASLPPGTTVPSAWQGFSQSAIDNGEQLLNSRWTFFSLDGNSPSLADLRDMDLAAAHLLVDGAFNVNSTSVPAWRAVLGSLRFASAPSASYPVPRIISNLVEQNSKAPSENYAEGIRVLSDSQLNDLAESIVREVQLRGPFLSMADFVNRRREAGSRGAKGALQAAIDASGINSAALSALGQTTDLTGPKAGDGNISLPSIFFYKPVTPSVPANTAEGAPGVITQADLLQPLAPILTARSDTFAIRVFGESGTTLPSGAYRLEGKAYGEAIVQRLPEYFDQTDPALSLNNLTLGKVAGNATPVENVNGVNQSLGRKYRIVSFRWLDPDEI